VSDGPEWFAQKRYGIGSGRPVTWQGWAVSIGFMALVAAAVIRFSDDRLAMFSSFITLLAIFLTIQAKTTRGGWRWHWGDDDH
jgi:hypothetical protein